MTPNVHHAKPHPLLANLVFHLIIYIKNNKLVMLKTNVHKKLSLILKQIAVKFVINSVRNVSMNLI